ncbi:MAG: 3-hydroxyacyl-ACP dehydratase FabZ [Burkholderiales bacterium]|nr:3-hydroxyacyl-ACP dehydratase FabZ [Burkholderiales bacterium]MDE1929810.1 3-hydroxyacyl-ACP dehydratase FabZ [Burkholderiales bacterium]MDE2161044.1 3-hydroxyacyl-ACP dehydratase FabZ [Burkholderiales bacterium]MDE2503348.1 3-hydroxyacyl-ACP dehydratase FabZ [Burkholderiales bacterium]
MRPGKRTPPPSGSCTRCASGCARWRRKLTVENYDIQRILRKLPHRYPFLLVDRVLELEKGVRIKALKNVTMNEPFFVGHFPVRPVMPGVLMLEALAQAAALLSFESADIEPGADTVVYFAGIDNARFKQPVVPGDQLILEAALDRAKAGIYRYKARGLVGDKVVVEADLMCTMRKVDPNA